MIPSLRQKFNASFTQEKYQDYLSIIEKSFPNSLDFRIAETPIFIDTAFTVTMLELGNYVNQQILGADYKKNTAPSLANQPFSPNETAYPNCIVMDFAIALDEKNNFVPK